MTLHDTAAELSATAADLAAAIGADDATYALARRAGCPCGALNPDITSKCLRCGQ